MSRGAMLCCFVVFPRLYCTVADIHPHNWCVSTLTPFTGVGEGCDAGVWRWWWMRACVVLVGHVHDSIVR